MNESVSITVSELCELFRARGISAHPATIADGIEQGVYPFAVCIKGKQRVFQISKPQAIKWLDWFCGK